MKAHESNMESEIDHVVYSSFNLMLITVYGNSDSLRARLINVYLPQCHVILGKEEWRKRNNGVQRKKM